MANLKFTYVVGDIHGCYAELLQLETQLQKHAQKRGATALIVSVGDLIDRGPQSNDVVQHFRKGCEVGSHAAVGGNHESSFFELALHVAPHLFFRNGKHYELPLYALDLQVEYESDLALQNVMSFNEFVEKMLVSWTTQGGRETLLSFGCDPENPSTWTMAEDDFLFLWNLPLHWENEKCVVTHALASKEDLTYARQIYAKEVSVARRNPEHYGHVKGMTWNRRAHETPSDDARFHVSGHTPRLKPLLRKAFRSVQTDTGCAYGNTLTAWCVDTHQFFSVPGKKKVSA